MRSCSNSTSSKCQIAAQMHGKWKHSQDFTASCTGILLLTAIYIRVCVKDSGQHLPGQRTQHKARETLPAAFTSMLASFLPLLQTQRRLLGAISTLIPLSGGHMKSDFRCSPCTSSCTDQWVPQSWSKQLHRGIYSWLVVTA